MSKNGKNTEGSPMSDLGFEMSAHSQHPTSDIRHTEESPFEAVFFHFHGVKLFEDNKVILAPKMYVLNDAVKAIFYEPYLQKLKNAQAQLADFDARFQHLGIQSTADYRADKRRGWFAFLKTNYFNTLFIQ